MKIQVRGFCVLNNLIYSMLSLVPNIASNAATTIRVSLQLCCYFGKLTATGSLDCGSICLIPPLELCSDCQTQQDRPKNYNCDSGRRPSENYLERESCFESGSLSGLYWKPLRISYTHFVQSCSSLRETQNNDERRHESPHDRRNAANVLRSY